MTKEEILNGMSEEEFYDMYPTPEDWENAQQMKLGGLSGAPHNGQPTADQFFNYGSHANDAVNVPMSNPFFAANGGTPYYGGPIRPYQKGGTSDYDNKYKEARKQDSTYYDPQYDVMSMFTTGSFDNYDAIDAAKKYGYVGGDEDFSKKQKELYDNPDRLGMIEGQEAAYRAYQKGTHKPVALTNDQVGQLGKLYEQYGDSWETNSPMYGKATYNFKENLSPYDYKRVKSMGEWYKEKHKKYGGYMDQGGNMASPMNYGAFSVPMQYGGYEQEYGGVIDPGNNQDYPILEQGGKSALMDIIKAHSKKMRKAYKDGGDTVMQGGNSTDKPTEIRNTFKNVLKRNIQNHMINEEEKAFSSQMKMGQMDMGGFSGPGMNYGATNFNEINEQNASLANMYQQRINDTQDNLNNDFTNLGNATSYLGATANPYQKTSVKAKYGAILPQAKYGDWDFSPEYQKSQRRNELVKALENKKRIALNQDMSDEDLENLAREEGLITDRATTNSNNSNSNYNRYFGESARGTSGMTYFPMNYNPYTKISKKDDALLRQIAANPSSNLKEYKNINLPLGFGRTKMTFGYKDLYENNMKIKDIPGTNKPKSNKGTNYSSQDTLPSSYALRPGVAVDNIYTPSGLKLPNSPMMQGPVQGAQTKNEASKGKAPFYVPTHSPFPLETGTNYAPGYSYGGLKRAQYGADHKSTNPADGLYDNAGKMLDSEPNSMNPVKMESISATPGFNNYIKDEGLKLKGQQEHLKDPETGSMFSGPEKKASITTKDRPGFDNEAMANWSIAGINTLAGGLEQGQNVKNQKQLANLQLADNAFMATPANAQSRGDYDPNSGMFRMDQMNPVQFPGGMGYSAYGGSMYQDGGMQEEMQAQPQQAAPQQEQIMQGVATMLQQGAQPEQVVEQLVQMGIPQEQAVKIIKAVMQQMQGGQEQAMEQPMQPAMRYGGYAMGGYQDEDSYEDDLDEDEIEKLRVQGYDVEYLD